MNNRDRRSLSSMLYNAGSYGAGGNGGTLTDMEKDCYRYYVNKACQKHTLGYCQGCALDLTPYLGENGARLRKYKRHRIETSESRGMLMLILGLIGVIIAMVIIGNFVSCSTSAVNNAYELTAFTAPVKVETGIQQKGVRDHNRDGMVNCIDYTIEWYNNHPGYDIIINRNPNTGMNHLFVKDFATGEAIEPQNGLPMKAVWGNMYDPAYDRSTSVYYGFCKPTWGNGW